MFPCLRLVQVVTNFREISLPAARIEVRFAALMDDSNERFIRTFHPFLESFDKVKAFRDIDGYFRACFGCF